MDVDSKPLSGDSDGCPEGKHVSSERKVSPEKLYRTVWLRSRFADTIVKAQNSLDQADRSGPEKLQREREEIERQRREERARLQAEAKAAEDARRRAEVEAAAEAKRKRDREREAARQALLQACTCFCLILLTLLQMEKTAEIDDYRLVLKDLEILTRIPAGRIPMSLNQKCPVHYFLDDVEGFRFGGSNPMEQLGSFMKVGDEGEEEGKTKRTPPSDVEEGEIISFHTQCTSSLNSKRSTLLNSKEEFLHSCLIGCDFSFLCAEMNTTFKGFLSLSSFCVAPSIGINCKRMKEN
ncbi:hypothetical protein C4D60_Mb03t02390 [Musa balbisiana]|uniref:Uncharacterized protein n=1 Tax=Musa balbisiana TaxID=52838 RepID=A0A4S8J9F2_MUSBA|nr:hypothetical protein C4D60_Mb03t02390 [Musa balbisiana]